MSKAIRTMIGTCNVPILVISPVMVTPLQLSLSWGIYLEHTTDHEDCNPDNDNTATDVIPHKLRPHNNKGNFWEPQGTKLKSQPLERLVNYISDDMVKGMNERSF